MNSDYAVSQCMSQMTLNIYDLKITTIFEQLQIVLHVAHYKYPNALQFTFYQYFYTITQLDY